MPARNSTDSPGGARSTFGIVGGYGATGRAVVAELLKSGEGDLLIGGRDQAKLEAVAAQFGSRVSAARLDVRDLRSLDGFCSRCSTIVNCGGPVTLLRDGVARAALRGHCHYLDPAGMSIVRERMLPQGPEIAKLGLSFVVSAGWMPGMTELLCVDAHARAKTRMDSIDSVSVYFSDSGEWSDNALRDGVTYLRQINLFKPYYFRNGERVRARVSEASRKVDLGDPIGLRRFSLFSMPELNEIGRRLTDSNFLPYSYLSGSRSAVAVIMIALLPLSEESRVRLLRGIFRRNRLAVGGFVAVRVVGRSEGRRATLGALVVFDAGRDYWMNGAVLATAARMVSAGNAVRPGVHFLFDAIDPTALMTDLQKCGVRHTETFQLGE